MMINYKLKMDLLSPGSTPVIHAVQDDSGSRQLELQLFSGSVPMAVPEAASVVVRYRKADGTGGEYDTLPDGTAAWSAKENTLTVALVPQVFTFPGTVQLSVTLTEGEQQLSCFPVLIRVQPVAHAKTAKSQNYFYITGLLPAPEAAKAGQYLRVASVNEAGRVTGVEAVTLSGAGEFEEAQVQEAVDAYLAENPPAPGADGITPHIGDNGNWYLGNTDTGKPSRGEDGVQGPQGEKGEAGAQGPQGEKGDTGAQGPQGEKGDTGAQGPQGEKGDDYVLTEADREEIAALVGGDGIPVYWQTELEEGAEAINTALLSAGYNKSAFLFYSDAHWNYGSQMSPRLLKYLYQHTGMTKTFFGGDIVNNEGTDYDTMAYLWDWRRGLKGLPNHHSVVGNHDDGNATNNLFSEQYVYGYLLGAEETPDLVRGDGGIYYYMDSPAEKTRYLCLDTAYQGVGSAQKEFIKNALLTTPEGWHIVAIAHIWHDTDYSVSPAVPSGINANAAILLTMFDNYNSRSGDYAECGGKVEFCIGGHTHWDYDSSSDGGIPIVLVEADGWAVRSGLDFTAGTVGEASVNGIVADYDNHAIHVVRVGRGESRVVNIPEESVSSTNVIPLSIGSDGNVFNSGTGWAANSRIGSSTLDNYIGGGNYYITGHIRIDPTVDNTFRLKNITFDSETSITSIGIAAYDSAFAREPFDSASSSNNWITPAQLVSGGSVFDVVLDGTNIVEFTLTADHSLHSGIQYIAICAEYIGEDSIITVNEPIA